MRGSLGLAAYRALSRRSGTGESPLAPARPKGELVWLHAAEPGSGRAIADLVRRMVSSRIGLNLLLTAADAAAYERFGPLPGNVTHVAPPSDHPAISEKFVDHWNPDAAIWVWGGLRPNTILGLARRQVPMILADAGRDGFDSRRDRWLPEVPRTLLGHFDQIMARSEAAKARLVQLGRPERQVHRAEPLQPIGSALPVRDEDLTDLTEALAGRPVWLAAHVQSSEIDTVLRAHFRALRQSHRLLLILHPSSQEISNCKETCQSEQLNTIMWSDGELPDESTQVLIADTPDEMGLWYRVAPVAFLGRSLNASGRGTDPFDAASLGTAILYGPHVRDHLAAYGRLASAGAARIVNDAHALGGSLAQLMAPDRAASMAMAGWDVATEGAAVIDRISDVVFSALDAGADGQF